MRMTVPVPTGSRLALCLVLAACKAPQAYGERSSLILRVDTAVWNAYEETIEAALEPRVFTVRPERTFNLTAVHPWQPQWGQLREWQQVLVFGTADDPVVTFLLGKANAAAEPWTAAQLDDVWARGQRVSVLVLPERVEGAPLRQALERLHAVLDQEYRAWVRDRMYASGINDSLIGALRARGFTLRLPNVYQYAIQDSFFLFRNVYPDPGMLIRSLLVTWVPDGRSPPDAERLRAWRDVIDERFYRPPQDVAEDGLRFDSVRVQGRTALEMRGVWSDRGDTPAAGPFVARAVPCPGQNRLYYMDAWLYAPGKDKYQYLLQLETLLASFRCTADE